MYTHGIKKKDVNVSGHFSSRMNIYTKLQTARHCALSNRLHVIGAFDTRRSMIKRKYFGVHGTVNVQIRN